MFYGGGGWIVFGSAGYNFIVCWISEGAMYEGVVLVVVVWIEIVLVDVVFFFRETQQLCVIVVDVNGKCCCVMVDVVYESNVFQVVNVEEIG